MLSFRRRSTSIALLAACLLLAGCGKSDTARAEKSGPPPAPVKIAKAELRQVPLEVRAFGNVEPVERVNVQSQVSGPIVRVHFQEGSDVRKGDLLFEIDPRPFQQALREAEANLAGTKAGLQEAGAAAEKADAEARRARSELDRFEPLAKRGIISRLQIVQYQTAAEAADRTTASARANIESARAQVGASEAQVAEARLQLSYASIRAPISGRTGSLSVKAGNLITANSDPPLVVINQMSPIYVTFTVPERALDEVRRYSATNRALPVQVVPGSESGRQADQKEGSAPISGVLDFIDNAVDQQTGTILLKALFRNEGRQLWPGRFVSVAMTLTSENVITVPSRAVQRGQSGDYVFVVKQDGTAEQRRIKAERTSGDLTVIASGVRPGESVVTDGQLQVKPGGKVSAGGAAGKQGAETK